MGCFFQCFKTSPHRPLLFKRMLQCWLIIHDFYAKMSVNMQVFKKAGEPAKIGI